MKREQRKPWWGLGAQLTRESGNEWSFGLCAFCRFCSVMDETDVECEHPIDRIRENAEDVAVNIFDCWAFRPEGTLESQAADKREWISEQLARIERDRRWDAWRASDDGKRWLAAVNTAVENRQRYPDAADFGWAEDNPDERDAA